MHKFKEKWFSKFNSSKFFLLVLLISFKWLPKAKTFYIIKKIINSKSLQHICTFPYNKINSYKLNYYPGIYIIWIKTLKNKMQSRVCSRQYIFAFSDKYQITFYHNSYLYLHLHIHICKTHTCISSMQIHI